MAGPEIKVSFLSDFSRFKQGVSDVSSSAKTAGSGLKDAFAPALSILNRSGVLGPFQDAISGVGDAIASVKEHINDLPLALAGAGAAVAGIGVALSLVGSKDKQAHQQLQASVEATGKSYDDYAAQVDQAIKHQEKFGNTAATTQDALRILTQATGDPTKALQYLNTATDLAAAKHESLTAAAGQLGKAYNGAGRLLKEFGLDAAPKAATATKALESATKAAAAADAASATAKQHLGDVMALLSSKGKISIADQIKLRDAQQAVAKAQEDVAHHVKGSTDELAKAQQKLGDTQAIVGGKARLSAADQIKLRDAQQNVAKAAATAKAAHEKMAGASDLAKKAASGQADTMTALSGKLKGQASAAADTFGGKLKELKARAEDSIATFGQKYGAALQATGGAMAGLGGAMKAGQAAMEAARAAALGTRIELMALSAWTKIQTAAQWLLNIAMDANPIVLIVLAIVALVAIIVLVLVKTGLLKTAWQDMQKAASAVWKAIKLAVTDVWDWIKANWPLLLGILTGPVGLAAALIYKYWANIKAGLLAVWNWIKTTWSQVYGFLKTPVEAAINWIKGAWGAVTGAIGGVVAWIKGTWNGLYSALTGTISRIVSWVSGAWGSVTSAVRGVVQTVEGIFNGLVSWFTGLPGRISNIAAHAFDGLTGAARGAINAVIGIWNAMASHTALNFSVGGQKVGPVTLPKLDVHTGQLIPDIPRLAQGGLITQTGLILAHAGEAITPLPKGRAGEAVHIENAHFHEEADLEAFMRKAAWYIQTSRI